MMGNLSCRRVGIEDHPGSLMHCRLLVAIPRAAVVGGVQASELSLRIKWCWCRWEKYCFTSMLLKVQSVEQTISILGSWLEMWILRLTMDLLNHNLHFTKIPCFSGACKVQRHPAVDGIAKLTSIVSHDGFWRSQGPASGPLGALILSFFKTFFSFPHKPAQTWPLLSSVPWAGLGTSWPKVSSSGLGAHPWPGEELIQFSFSG